MDGTQLPFNRLIGLELAGQNSGFLVTIPDDLQYTNHLGTVHGSALLAVAEASFRTGVRSLHGFPSINCSVV